MAELRNAGQKGITPEQAAGWLQVLLQLADAIVRLFGRRSTDRPEREEPDAEPPR